MEELSAQAVEAIQWRTNYDYTREQHPLTLQATIARTQHLVRKWQFDRVLGG
jgi:hypothetical protein